MTLFTTMRSGVLMRRHTAIGPILYVTAVACLMLGQSLTAQGSHVDQQADKKAQKSCQRAARVVKAQAGVPKDDRDRDDDDRGDGENNSREDVQYASAGLLSCGAYGGSVAAATIRSLRTEANMARLTKLTGAFASFRDTAVYNALSQVARDKSASEPARIQAWLGLYVLRTGAYWTGVQELYSAPMDGIAKPMARCGQGVSYSDAHPFWHEGTPLAPTYQNDIRNLARQIWNDPTQPLSVRAAASCSV
jgi:hypothetical protein